MGIKEILEHEEARVAREFVSVKMLVEALAEDQACSKSDVAKFLLHNVEKLGKVMPDLMVLSPEALKLEKEITATPLWPILKYLDTAPVTEDINLFGWERDEIFKFLKGCEGLRYLPMIPDWTPQDASTLKPAPSERLLGTKERTTLLCVIGALLHKLGIDPYSPERGTSAVIARETESIGATVSDDTISGILKKIPDAINLRGL